MNILLHIVIGAAHMTLTSTSNSSAGPSRGLDISTTSSRPTTPPTGVSLPHACHASKEPDDFGADNSASPDNVSNGCVRLATFNSSNVQVIQNSPNAFFDPIYLIVVPHHGFKLIEILFQQGEDQEFSRLSVYNDKNEYGFIEDNREIHKSFLFKNSEAHLVTVKFNASNRMYNLSTRLIVEVTVKRRVVLGESSSRFANVSSSGIAQSLPVRCARSQPWSTGTKKVMIRAIGPSQWVTFEQMSCPEIRYKKFMEHIYKNLLMSENYTDSIMDLVPGRARSIKQPEDNEIWLSELSLNDLIPPDGKYNRSHYNSSMSDGQRGVGSMFVFILIAGLAVVFVACAICAVIWCAKKYVEGQYIIQTNTYERESSLHMTESQYHASNIVSQGPQKQTKNQQRSEQIKNSNDKMKHSSPASTLQYKTPKNQTPIVTITGPNDNGSLRVGSEEDEENIGEFDQDGATYSDTDLGSMLENTSLGNRPKNDSTNNLLDDDLSLGFGQENKGILVLEENDRQITT